MLFEVEPTSPLGLQTPFFALGTVAVLAAVAPVLRAIRIDPSETLRVDG